VEKDKALSRDRASENVVLNAAGGKGVELANCHGGDRTADCKMAENET